MRSGENCRKVCQHVRRYPPASLWMHFMFAASKKAKDSKIHLGDKPDLRAGLSIWLGLSTTSQEGPWYRWRHYDLTPTTAASGASSTQFGGVILQAILRGRGSAASGYRER